MARPTKRHHTPKEPYVPRQGSKIERALKHLRANRDAGYAELVRASGMSKNSIYKQIRRLRYGGIIPRVRPQERSKIPRGSKAEREIARLLRDTILPNETIARQFIGISDNIVRRINVEHHCRMRIFVAPGTTARGINPENLRQNLKKTPFGSDSAQYLTYAQSVI